MAKNDESGRLWLEGEVIYYTSRVYGTWELPVSQVRVIGEYTNPYGPFVDDYFIVFLRSAHEAFDASFYAGGRDVLLKRLSSALGHTLECSLCGSTDFDSRIWWPKELAGQKMFDFKREGLLGKLGLQIRQYLSNAVVEFLADSSRRQCGRSDRENRGGVGRK